MWNKDRIRNLTNKELYDLSQDESLSRFELQQVLREMGGRFCLYLSAGIIPPDKGANKEWI